MKLLRALLDLLYPPKCPFCGRILERGEDGMCAQCQQELPWTEGEGKTVEGCDACLSPLRYRDGVRDGMHRYKFGGGMGHAALFGQLMAQCLADRWTGTVDVITYVPLRPERKTRRGYDQAELLARRVGELTGLPVVPGLQKVRHTETQSLLRDAAARRANVTGAYALLPGLDAAGKRVVLVEDIVTSGATLSECAALLRQAGAEEITALTLARAK